MTQIPDKAVQAALDKCEKVDWVQGLFGTGLSGREIIESALTAAIPHLPLGYEVKKLEWEYVGKYDDHAKALEAAKAAPAGEPVALTYTNYRGETSVRRITPMGIHFGSTDWHPEPQWLVRAYDHDKQATRDFAFKDFGKPVDVAAVRRQAYEEAAKWLDDWSTKTMSQDVSPDYAATAIRAISAEPPLKGQQHDK